MPDNVTRQLTRHPDSLRRGRFQDITCAFLTFCLSFAASHLSANPPEQGEPVAKSTPSEPVYFEDQIAPILQKHCIDCHDPDTHEGKLDLTTVEGLLKGSESGPVVVPRNSKHSLLYELVHGGEMPPGDDRLSPEEVHQIEKWIGSGAQFRHPPENAFRGPTQHDVIPILLLRCTVCHGAELKQGDLDLRTVESLRKGGKSGAAVIEGDPAASPLITRIEDQSCPPRGQLLKYFVERPTSTELETLQAWIKGGLREEADPSDVAAGTPDPHVTEADRQHWAFQPLPEKVTVPQFEGVDLPQPIDAFIYEKLAQNGLDFSPRAGRNELIRRLYFDLTGLPPTLAELERWEQHSGESWYTELVDELLASPKYGERWGRYWLDIAGYADSEGGVSSDPVRDVAWKYRDYVIRSFNADKPWDRFLQEQLAGDELADYTNPKKVTDEVSDNLIATGFLRMTVDETGSRTMNFVPERLGLISDAMQVVSSGVLGLTMGCARCHSHRYDPIPQADYYRMKAIFQGAFDEHDWMSWRTRKLEVASPQKLSAYKKAKAPLEKERKALEAEKKKVVTALQDRYYEEQWPLLEPDLQEEIQAALKSTVGFMTTRQKELIQRYETEIRPSETELAKRHPEVKVMLDRLQELQQQMPLPLEIRALWDRGRPSPTYMLIRGEYNRPGRIVGPGVPSVLTDGESPFVVQPPWPDAPSTGRRLAFARWLTGPNHPLTARVLVNRIWSVHFGRGIVKTADNFGTMGAPPTHPELLNWLSREFVNSGWSLKSLHRSILLSRTWQQGITRTEDRDRIDPENKLLSRMTLRRLDAEALRDAMISVAGLLDPTQFGPPAPVSVREDGLIMEQDSPDGRTRRSIYLQLRRTEMPTLLSSFDYPEMQPNCTERAISVASTQSLVLKNNGVIYQRAGRFAEEILKQSGNDPAEMVRLVYRSAFSRSPTDDELSDGQDSLLKLQEMWKFWKEGNPDDWVPALTTYCHTVLNSAEFSFID